LTTLPSGGSRQRQPRRGRRTSGRSLLSRNRTIRNFLSRRFVSRFSKSFIQLFYLEICCFIAFSLCYFLSVSTVSLFLSRVSIYVSVSQPVVLFIQLFHLENYWIISSLLKLSDHLLLCFSLCLSVSKVSLFLVCLCYVSAFSACCTLYSTVSPGKLLYYFLPP
jgi:hypothetical protein